MIDPNKQSFLSRVTESARMLICQESYRDVLVRMKM